MKFRAWLQGAGVAAIVLFPFYRGVLSSPGFLRMHTAGSAANLALSLIANLVLVSLIFALLGNWLRRSGWTWLRLMVPPLVLTSLAEIVYIAYWGWESTRVWTWVLTATLILTLLLHWRSRQRDRLLFRLSGAVLIGMGFFCILTMLQLLHLAAWRQPPNLIARSMPSSKGMDRPRIVWILFDELSYQQVFGDRYPGLEMPNFDEFKKSSSVFTDVQPLVNSTDEAVPSMLVGQRVERVNYTSDNQLELLTSNGLLRPFDVTLTPFALARHQGLTTGVAGWYNPYCSILDPYLNRCYWTDEFPDQPLIGHIRFWPNALHPWRVYAAVFAHPVRMMSKSYRKTIITEIMVPETFEKLSNPNYRVLVFRDLRQHAMELLQPSGPDFVFVHLPVPHPPGFYNRKTQQFDISGDRSYIDNLALADKTLGQLLAILRRSPRWNDTSIVMCGDHSWRTFMWPGLRYWTPEDEAASHGGVFDSRPLLMVHLAGQTTPATMNEPFPLLRVHDILNDLVTGKQPTFSVEQSENLRRKRPSPQLKAMAPCTANLPC
jgi:hypothetical protein